MPVAQTLLLSVTMFTGGNVAVNIADDNAVTLNWAIPQKRNSGVALPENQVGGYQIKYGLDDSPYLIIIKNPKATTITLYDLDVGTNTFYLRAFDLQGLKGEWSEAKQITIKTQQTAQPD